MSFFCSDIIRREKLYKIAAVLTIKIKKFSASSFFCCNPPTPTLPQTVLLPQVWGKFDCEANYPIIPGDSSHKERGGMKDKDWKKHSFFRNQPFSLCFFFCPFCQKLLPFSECKIATTFFIILIFFYCGERLCLMPFVFCLLVRPHVFTCCHSVRNCIGFLSFQCCGLAWELHAVQIQPKGLHGHQLCGLWPCGETF